MVTTLSVSQDLQYLVELFPRDSMGALHPLYLSTRDIALAANDPTAPNREYDGRVQVALVVKREMFADGRIGGKSLPAYGNGIEIAVDSDWKAANYPLWKAWGWDGAQARVLQGPRGSTSYAAYSVLWDGQCTGENSFGLGSVQVPLSDLQTQIDKDIESTTYDGSGGFNGGTDLKGKVKPTVLGQVLRAAPVPVDTANLWYDLSPLTGLHSVQAVYDGGVPLTASASNPPPAGNYYADLANGRLRLGSTPARQITVDCRGAFGSNATTAADICKALLTGRLGFASGQIDDTSFAALNTKNSATVGYYAAERATGTEVLDALIGSVGGFYTGSNGKVVVGRLEAPTATSSSDSALALYLEDADLEKGALTVNPEAIPPYRLIVKAARSWVGALQESDLAGAATAAMRAFFAEEYRSTTPVDVAAVQTLHPLSKPLEVETCLLTVADAQTEAARLSGLYSTRREVLTLRIETQPFSIELGGQVWISSALHVIDQAYRVIGIEENTRDSGRVTLTLWG
ncbi:hypothetical protein FZ983_32365 [Azospirillum sp. B21]|uniref:hypothetical protein n=1 Tax=Azospirillum sp. B21 TaxID=2607496 RepID=UPI0011EC6332|nr:hypothetical protein [Azospirillum sp. B21]KAA0572267.1 hypothetical protein FZ983_32365 [Azospirillum sp. B21]